MLERTAGCLESSSLRRLLPASQQSVKSRRTLHSAFWTHAAEDIEPSPLWAALVRAADLVGARDHPRPYDNEATFLEFLYTPSTLNFLRTCSSWRLDKQDNRSVGASLVKLGQRLYTSSAKSSLLSESRNLPHVKDQRETLVRGMKIMRPHDYDEAWRQYLLLDVQQQNKVRAQLLAYYSTSPRVLDAERTIDLFQSVGIESKGRQEYQYVIRAYLRLRNVQDAMLAYKACFKLFDEPIAADEVFAYFFDLSLWSRACEIWWDVERHRQQNPTCAYSIYGYAENLPNFGTQISALAEYVDRTVPDIAWKVEELYQSTEAVDIRTLSQPTSEHAPQSTPQTTSEQALEGMAQAPSRASPSITPEMRSQDGATASDWHRNLARFAARVVQHGFLRKQSFNSSLFITLFDHLLRWDRLNLTIFTKVYYLLISMNELPLLVKCYLKVRQKPSTRMFGPVILHSVLKAFCLAHDTKGMQYVMDDFYFWYGKPSQHAYRQCMREFAAQANTNAVYELFNRFIEHHTSKDRPLNSPGWLSPILQVHSKRGEIAEVIRVFDSISDVYGLKPTILEWNILINAHGRVHDYDQAFACFEQILSSPDIAPDDYTIGTLMGISVQAGDLESTVALYQLAADLGITRTIAMMDCLVLAHLQNDRLEEAEKFCQDAIWMRSQGSLTRMWNQLIVAYAERRDLRSANRILQLMSAFNIVYDEYTYAALMQALAMVRQPNEARKIMEDVLPSAGFNPTAFHLAIVMGGYIAIRDWWNVNKLYSRLMSQVAKTSSSITAMMLKARVRKDEKLFERGSNEQLLQRSTEMFFEIVGSLESRNGSNDDPRKSMGRNPTDIAYSTSLYSYMMYVFADHNMIESVRALYERYMDALPLRRRENPPPLSIISALIFSHWRERDYKGVEACWELALNVAQERGRSLAPLIPILKSGEPDGKPKIVNKEPKILYRHELDLAKTLSWYLTSLATQGLTDKMIVTVANFIDDGFSLDMRNWNLYVRLLSRQDRPRLAFMTCEERLMPNWTGWARIRQKLQIRNRLPLEIRAKRKDPRWIRPISQTLTLLARSYLDIQAAAADSRASRMMLKDLERLCPKTMLAIKSMPRSNDDSEREIMERF